jgi:two-component system sensor histidine kinase KdpD
LKEGVYIVVGAISTHGRKETEEVLKGLPRILEKKIEYKGKNFEEMDLESILQANPQIVLVDELAHTNVPGSKHLKRWQDVVELLEANIDVYTTLNVQHIESRKDIVENLTGITVRETVPDLILEQADFIELIDISPNELLQRLQEGKVYLGDPKISIAVDHFFKEENLTVLRNLALRFTAEKVEHDLHGVFPGKTWKSRELLMVAISTSPSSEQLIRSTRRLAFELDAPWIAVYVSRGETLDDPDQKRLHRHFQLARELGAEVITTYDLEVLSALQRVAKNKGVTRLVIGRPPRRKKIWNLFEKHFFYRLENDNKQVDIVILRQENEQVAESSFFSFPIFSSRWQEYLAVLVSILGTTLVGLLISAWIGYKSVGFLFLLGILLVSLFVGMGPVLVSAVVSGLCWEYFFVPPIFNVKISDSEDSILVFIYFCTAAILGGLASRMRKQKQFLHRREASVELLYEIEKEITAAVDVQVLRSNICLRLSRRFSGEFTVFLQDTHHQLIFDSSLPFFQKEREKAAALWVFQKGKIGGWSTDTLPLAQGLYFPIMSSRKTLAVLAYVPQKQRPLLPEELNFIQTVTHEIGIYLHHHGISTA